MTDRDLEHQSERRAYWRARAENAEARVAELEQALRDEIEMEDQARECIERAVTLICAGFDTEVTQGLALLDNALQDLLVSSEARALAAGSLVGRPDE